MDSSQQRTTTTPFEAVVVTGIAFGLFIFASLRAVADNFPTTPFSDGSLLGLAVTELFLAASALTFLYRRGYAISTLMPAPSLRGTAIGFVLYFIAGIVGNLLAAPFAAALPEQPIEAMMSEAKVTPVAVVTLAMVNGTFEEVFLLGFLLRGLRTYGTSIALGTMLLVRMLYHLYQGPLGPLWVAGFGLAFALYYMRYAQLWPPIFAHILWDIVPFMDA